jgi:dihydrofolate reductase
VIDISIYPVVVGRGKPFLREGQNANLKLVRTKSFSKESSSSPTNRNAKPRHWR